MSGKRKDTIYNHANRILNIIEGSLFYNHDFEYDGDDYQDVGISYDEYKDENLIWERIRNLIGYYCRGHVGYTIR